MMGYYTRVFCATDKIPCLESIIASLSKRGIILKPDDADLDLSSDSWKQVAFVYKDRKSPIFVECNRDDGISVFREEVNEFLELIGSPGWSLSKRRVIKHIGRTRAIIACQLPTFDIDEDGYAANGEIMNLFVGSCDGMIQADGQGFYEGSNVLVQLK